MLKFVDFLNKQFLQPFKKHRFYKHFKDFKRCKYFYDGVGIFMTAQGCKSRKSPSQNKLKVEILTFFRALGGVLKMLFFPCFFWFVKGIFCVPLILLCGAYECLKVCKKNVCVCVQARSQLLFSII